MYLYIFFFIQSDSGLIGAETCSCNYFFFINKGFVLRIFIGLFVNITQPVEPHQVNLRYSSGVCLEGLSKAMIIFGLDNRCPSLNRTPSKFEAWGTTCSHQTAVCGGIRKTLVFTVRVYREFNLKPKSDALQACSVYNIYCNVLYVRVKVKVKFSRYRPKSALGDPVG